MYFSIPFSVFQTRRRDLSQFLICLIATLVLGVRNGILVGILAALVLQSLRLFLFTPIPLGSLPIESTSPPVESVNRQIRETNQLISDVSRSIQGNEFVKFGEFSDGPIIPSYSAERRIFVSCLRFPTAKREVDVAIVSFPGELFYGNSR